ncbi:hypothetical protein BO221_20440 [Archangium sp. Cb G35]|nr:hypothetical protein BO221_20440 [Archangium sp. Cb G35]
MSAVECVRDVERSRPPIQCGLDGQTDQDNAAPHRQHRAATHEGTSRRGGAYIRCDCGPPWHKLEYGAWNAIAQAFANNSLEQR